VSMTTDVVRNTLAVSKGTPALVPDSVMAGTLPGASASAVVTAVLGETFVQAAYLAVGFCLYLARQGVAISATTILQEEVDDAYRGRVFAFYDMMFNVPYVIGAALSSAFMPPDGRSPAIIGVVAAGYAAAAVAYWLYVRRGQPPSGPGGGGMMPSAAAQSSSS